MEEVVGEVLFDQVALVAAADNEVVNTVLRIYLKNVPKDGPTADFDHRLGAYAGFFAQPGTQSPRQNTAFMSASVSSSLDSTAVPCSAYPA